MPFRMPNIFTSCVELRVPSPMYLEYSHYVGMAVRGITRTAAGLGELIRAGGGPYLMVEL